MTAFQDFREFLEASAKLGEVRTIRGAKADLEVGAVTEVANELRPVPLTVFEDIDGVGGDWRVATNFLGSDRRESLVYGIDPELPLAAAMRTWKERVKDFTGISPRFVNDGSVLEIGQEGDDVDITKLPFLRWHEGDGGGYLCGTAVTMCDPQTGYVNVGSYRFKLVDEKTMVYHIGSGHNGDVIRKQYWEQGKACPVTISLGQDPAVFVAAGTNLKYGAEEYDYAGWLRGAPVDLIKSPLLGVPMPAEAEVVVEADLLPPSEGMADEGPFGEASGYYGGGVHQAPLVAVRAVWHRPNAIVLGAPPMPGTVRSRLGSRAVQIWNELEQLGIPNVTAVNYGWGLCIIALKQAFAGHAMRAAHGALGGTAGYHSRVMIVVDEDVNVYDADEVLWAIATRCDPETSIDVARRIWGYRIDPRLSPEKRARGDLTGSSVIIDATRPYHWRDEFPEVTGFDLGTKAAIREKWKTQLTV
jgi:4-hydroxy-3-polyprenylbenzoate decarboxylase